MANSFKAFGMRVAMNYLGAPPDVPQMEKASDVFFLDAESLKSLRGRGVKTFNHDTIRPKDLIRQAPLIEELREMVDQSNEEIKHQKLPEGSKVVYLKEELKTTKDVTKLGLRKVQKLERDLAHAEVLEKQLIEELRKSNVPESSGRSAPDIMKEQEQEKKKGKKDASRIQEIKAIAKAVGMKIKNAGEMYDKVKLHGNFDGQDDYEFGMDDFVVEVIDRIKEGSKDAQTVKTILSKYHRNLASHEVDKLLKVSIPSPPSPATSPGKGYPEVDVQKLLRGMVVMRRLHLLAQVEGGLEKQRRDDDDSTVLSFASKFSSKSSITDRTNISLPPVRISTATTALEAPSVDRETPRVLRGNPDKAPTLSELRSELEYSSRTLNNLDKAMKRDVALVSQNYTIKSQNARKMSFIWGLEKIEIVGKTMLRNCMWLAFKRLLRYDRYKQNSNHAATFVKTLNARIIGRLLSKWLQYKFVSMFLDWKQRANYEKELEEHSAVLEMQASVRMRQGVKKTQIKRENRAANNIQRIHRGNGGRQATEARREYLRIKWAAMVIENAWINLGIIRNARRIVREKKESKAASVIQRRLRTRQAGRRVALMKQLRDKERKCLQIQCLFRGYTTRCEVYDNKKETKRFNAATKIQTMVRRFMAWWEVEDVRERHAAAVCIQSNVRGSEGKRKARIEKKGKAATEFQRLFRGMLCRKKIEKRRRWIAAQFSREARCTIKIQNAFRMRKAVKKAMLRRETKARIKNEQATALQRLARGRKSRMDFAKKKEFRRAQDMMNTKQRKSSVLIQSLFRKNKAGKVFSGKRDDKERQNMDARATKIQGLFRGKKGRKRSSVVRKEYQRMLEEKTYGVYYSLQRKYMREQNERHGTQAELIQANVRIFLSKCKVHALRGEKGAAMEAAQMNHAAMLIQNKSSGRNANRELDTCRLMKGEQVEAKRWEIELEEEKERGEQNGAATLLQRRQRGRACRREFGKKKEAMTQDRSATKLQSAQRRRQAKKEVEKRMKEKMENEEKESMERHEKNVSATRLQAVFRGNKSRVDNEDYMEELKAKKAKKEALIMAMAVTRMQCGWRRNRARRVFKKRQKMAGEEKKLKEEDEELERNLEMLHKEQEMLLYVMRVQNCWRVKKARQKFDIARIAHQQVGTIKREKLRERSILKLQSWFRGVQLRYWWKKNLFKLKEELEYRSWCVECMATYASRRCTTCLDRYCDNCWGLIHKNGRKRQHAWDKIEFKPDAVEEQSSLGGSWDEGGSAGANSEWAEYWDESAGAKYWYNVNTGEAKWVKPF